MLLVQIPLLETVVLMKTKCYIFFLSFQLFMNIFCHHCQIKHVCWDIYNKLEWTQNVSRAYIHMKKLYRK
jgi:hypothetical protein